ncbi:MAG: molybdopterin-synthase adenylyltransferase MoeB [Roseiarcus sp.]|jgi:adenylyltransferase/sulfurtransferase
MLSAEEVKRYARHIVLRDVGGPGQQKIKAARVLVVGAGGLGSPVLEYLAAAGVGALGVVDDDRVSLSNLQRQIIHATPDIGRLKVESARDRIALINPNVAVEMHAVRLDAGNVDAIVAAYDIVVDGADNFPTRFVVADACEKLHKPLVSAAVLAFYGTLTVLMPFAQGPGGATNPSLRTIMHGPEEMQAATCAEIGILGSVAGVLGTLAATEALKLITGVGVPLVRRMLSVDLRDMSFDEIDYE